jgi:hypothetical protein
MRAQGGHATNEKAVHTANQVDFLLDSHPAEHGFDLIFDRRWR